MNTFCRPLLPILLKVKCKSKMEFFEEKLNEFEADSFDLKMQHYYSKMKTSGKSDVVNDCDTTQQCFGVRTHDDIETREANNSGRQKMAQLELELSELRVSKYAEVKMVHGHAGSHGISLIGSSISSKANDLAHLSENRRRERQATVAVAEHDTILIHQLQRAISMLQSRHDDDAKQAKNNDEKIFGILKDNNEKSLLISGLEIECQKANALVRSLRAQLTSTTTLLEDERSSNRIAREDAFIAKDGERHLIGTQEEKKTHSPPLTANKFTDNKSNYGSDWSAVSKLRGGGEVDSPNSFSNKQLHSKISVLSNGDYYALRGQQPTRTIQNVNNGKLMTSSSYEKSLEIFHTPSANRLDIALDYSVRGCDSHLRAENIELLRTLERERILLHDQEIVVNKIRDSAVEITLLEAEEIARLENDLAQCHEEKNIWRGKCRAAEYLAQDLTQQLKYLDLVIKKNGFTLSYQERDAFDFSKRHRYVRSHLSS